MRRKKAVTSTLAAGFALTLTLMLAVLVPSPPAAQAAAPKAGEAAPRHKELQDFAANLGQVFHEAAEAVSPAVVYISSKWTVTVRTPGGPFRDTPFERFFGPEYRDFFGPREYEREYRGLGSGLIIAPEGYILTNNHVVGGADELKVTLADKRTFDAETVGTDPATDLAVIKLKGDLKDLPTAKLGDSDTLQVGEWVVAIGNPFGFDHTVSAGIVSAKGRMLGKATYEHLIQTDAAINPGNSGGPLVNLKGDVVGINNAIVSPTGGFLGIGFAIPINMAKEILADLKAGKTIERGFLGIRGEELSPEMAKHFGYKDKGGALVDEVTPDTPAEKAGIQDGDIITHWNGKEVENFQHLRRMVAATDPDSKAMVTVWRDGKQQTLPLKVARLAEFEAMEASGWLHIRVAPLPDEGRRRFGRKRLQGVLVTEVADDSRARGFIEEGDVILSVNQRPVGSVDDYQQAIAGTDAQKGVLLRVLSGRTGRARYVLIPGR